MRTPGIEPGAQAWEACMLPLHYERHWPPSGFSTWVEYASQFLRVVRCSAAQAKQRDTLAEWLRRRPAKPVGSAREGSNPSGVEVDFFFLVGGLQLFV